MGKRKRSGQLSLVERILRIRPNQTGVIFLVLTIVLGFAAGASTFWLGSGASQTHLFIFAMVFALVPTLLLFVVFKNSTATATGEYYGVRFSLTGAAAAYLVFVVLFYCITPGPEYKAIQFVITQGNSVYRHLCAVEFQIPPANNRVETIDGGSKTISGVPAGTKGILVWSVQAFGEDYTPQGEVGGPPWHIPIDESDTVAIDLGPKPQQKECNPPSPTEMKQLLVAQDMLEDVRKQYEQVKDDESREETRARAHVTVTNKTHQPINLIGMDCRKLWEPPNLLDLEDPDWLNFLRFQGKDIMETRHFNRFPEMSVTSGLYCMFACVPVPEGERAVFLGVFDFLEHEESSHSLVLNGSKGQPIILVSDDAEN